jgi:type IV pilus assembly protein PilF
MKKLDLVRSLAFAATLMLVGCGANQVAPEPELSTDIGQQTGESGDPRNRARIHSELGGLYFQRGNMGVALEELRMAILADPSYAPAYNVLGLVYMDLRENTQAQSNFERALRLSPNDADINHNYGLFLCQTGREADSLRYFLAAIRNPLYSQAQKSYAAAGACAVKAKNDRDAADYLERALRIDPDYLPALMSFSQLLYKRGELERARTTIARFNKVSDQTAESLWLALRIERKLGDKAAENSLATQLRRRFSGSPEYQNLLQGQFE